MPMIIPTLFMIYWVFFDRLSGFVTGSSSVPISAASISVSNQRPALSGLVSLFSGQYRGMPLIRNSPPSGGTLHRRHIETWWHFPIFYTTQLWPEPDSDSIGSR